MKFKELKFKDLPEGYGKDAKQARATFANGYEVSVVRHKGSYGSEKGLYELGLFDSGSELCDPLDWGDTVKGWLTPDGVEKELELIKSL